MADEQKSEGIYGLWKENVPSDYRWFLQSLFGEKGKPFTEKDLNKKELQMLDARIKEFDNARLQKYIKDLEYKKENLASINSIKPNADEFIKRTSQDPEWKEFSRLFKIQNHNPKQHERYWELNNKLFDRYRDVIANESTFYGSLGKNPQEIKQLYDDAYKKYTNNGQLQELQGGIKNLENKLANYSTLPGNVQYKIDEKYDDTLDTLHGDTIEQTFGRFNYNKLPNGKIQAVDNYDWMNEYRGSIINELEAMNPIQRAAWTAKNAGKYLLQGKPVLAGNVIGTAYVGREGRPVNVTYDPKEIYKKSGGTIEMPAEYSNGKWKLI